MVEIRAVKVGTGRVSVVDDGRRDEDEATWTVE
jgi:hypothetical protein